MEEGLLSPVYLKIVILEGNYFFEGDYCDVDNYKRKDKSHPSSTRGTVVVVVA